MPDAGLMILICVIIVALTFDFINGFNDTANAIATCVSTRALTIRTAIIMAASLNLVGALISTKVAATIGTGIIDPESVSQLVILAGICAAIIWGLTTWYFALPSSSSHALIGGLIGAVVAQAGFKKLQWLGIKKIILALVISPIAAAVVGFLFMLILLWICRNQLPYSVNKNFRRLQIFSAAIMAFSHGTADAQKSMGIITMALVSYGALNSFTVPHTVMIACALAMAFGTAIGGWRIIKTVGKDIVKLQPIHGFCVQTASAAVILGASAFGLPTSTSHVITSSIFGVGVSKRMSAVNWKIAHSIVWAWVLTIPASGVVAFILYAVLHAFSQFFK
ncbi:MAG: inorganic phosphate transporter [Gammaproteobacteria bacterium]|nr:inorganic phosphate transporter [Gammaproteobacteria bacterium]